MPEWRTGWTVIVAVGTIKLCRAATASGMPMECPPPSTSVALGLLTPAISSASASPASTSPPTVFKMTSSPSISGSSSMSTSCGMTCSYFVVFCASGERVCPSIVPMTVRQWMAWRPFVAGTMPSSVIKSCSRRFSAAFSVGFSLGRALALGFFAFASIPALLITKVAAQTKSAQRQCKICAVSGDGSMMFVDVVKKFPVIFVQPSNIWEISQKLRQKIDNWCGAFYNSYK